MKILKECACCLFDCYLSLLICSLVLYFLLDAFIEIQARSEHK